MIWFIGYVIVAIFAARYVRIWIKREHDEALETVSEWHRPRTCCNVDCPECFPGVMVDAKGLWAFLAGLVWPVGAAMMLIAMAIYFGTEGIKMLFKVIGSLPLWRAIAAVNRWFWQDPKDRKKDKCSQK